VKSPVDETQAVEIAETCADLKEVVAGLRLRKLLASLYFLLQSAILSIFQRQIDTLRVFEMVKKT
jgi:hypothetical protein